MPRLSAFHRGVAKPPPRPPCSVSIFEWPKLTASPSKRTSFRGRLQPFMANSRPMPDSFMPPNGACGVAGARIVQPANTRFQPFCPYASRDADPSLVNTYAAKP